MKSTPNSLPNAQELEQKAIEKASVLNPEFAGLLGHYGMYVPEFSDHIREIKGEEINYGRSKRAGAELRGLIFDKEGREFSERAQKEHVEIFVIRIRAKLAQLLNNPQWLKAFEEHEEREDARLAKEQEKMQEQGEPRDLTRLIRRRFQSDLIDNKGQFKFTFENSPRTRVKMANEMLVHPTERLVHEGKTLENEQGILERLIIDPQMITDTLLRNLGLDEFLPPKKTSKKEKVRLRALAIPQIVERLGKLQPIMPDPHDKLAEKYCRTFGTFDGYVLGTTNTIRGKQLFRANLVDAVNRLTHIGENQEAEIAKLRLFNSVIKDVDYKISEEWEQVKSSGELDKIRANLQKLVDSLRYVTNKFKKEMLALIQDCVTMESTFTRRVKDKATGTMRTEVIVRLNPGAKRAKLNQVPIKVAERIQEIGCIGRYLSEDRVRLVSSKEDHEQIPFGKFKEYIEERARAPKAAGRGKNLDQAEIDELKGRMDKWRMEFSESKRGLVLEPYRCFAAQLARQFNNADVLMTFGNADRRRLAEVFTKMYLVVKLQSFWSSLQTTYEKHLASPGMPFFIQLRDELRSLKAMIRGKTVAIGIKTQEFDDVYHMFYELLDKLIDLAEQGKAAMKDKDEDTARKLKGEMYKAVADVDIVKVINSIK